MNHALSKITKTVQTGIVTGEAATASDSNALEILMFSNASLSISLCLASGGSGR